MGGDGAVLPILHLNCYKIVGPTVLGRIDQEELDQPYRGYGHKPYFVEGNDHLRVHEQLAATRDTIVAEIKDIQNVARLSQEYFPGEAEVPELISCVIGLLLGDGDCAG